jgi:hypothetical protein
MPSLQQLSLLSNDNNLSTCEKEVTLGFKKLRSFKCNYRYNKIYIFSQRIEKIYKFGNDLCEIEMSNLRYLKYINIIASNLKSL